MNVATLIRAVPGMTAALAEIWFPAIIAAWDEFEVPETEIAMWLAQCGHESASFGRCRELWGPTPQQERYERDFAQPWPLIGMTGDELTAARYTRNRLAFLLGNDAAGDGSKYRGHGPIQITGKYNHERCGKRLGIDLVTAPSIIATDPLQGARSACWFWRENKLHRFPTDVAAATRVINGGLTGLQDRLKRYEIAVAALQP